MNTSDDASLARPPVSVYCVDDTGDDDSDLLFLVNKAGFPIKDDTWERMWTRACKLFPDGKRQLCSVRAIQKLPQISVPQPPPHVLLNGGSFCMSDRLSAIQNYISQLQYNHIGTQFFEIRKNRPISGLMDTAKEMIKEALPIKCLEAVILAIHLTNELHIVDRFTISFKTVFRGNAHRHVVLGISHNGLFGALGISRRHSLMFKDLAFTRLSLLVMDFIYAYKKYWHVVKKVKIGSRIPHDQYSCEQIGWKSFSFNAEKLSSSELGQQLDHCAKMMKIKFKPADTVPSTHVPCQSEKTAPTSMTHSTGTRSGTKPKRRSAQYSRHSMQRGMRARATSSLTRATMITPHSYATSDESLDGKNDIVHYQIRI